jgi:hypothetical protein
MKPAHTIKTNEPVKYHCYDSCNKCKGVNDYHVTDSLDGRMMECKTKCKECGFTDSWAHGWFESSQNIESKCATYSFK